jgi:hypothetical protein
MIDAIVFTQTIKEIHVGLQKKLFTQPVAKT